MASAAPTVLARQFECGFIACCVDKWFEWVYVDSVEFADWVATQDPGSNTWARIAELKAARPQL